MSIDSRYAEVAFPIPLPRTYGYLIPEDWGGDVGVGSLVAAPLGKHESIGCIVEVRDKPPEGMTSLRCLARRVTPDFAIDPALVSLAHWMADYYLCNLGEALQAVSFVGFTDQKETPERTLTLAPEWKSEDPAGGVAGAEDRPSFGDEAAIALALLRSAPGGRLPAAVLRKQTGVSDKTLKALVKVGAVIEQREARLWVPRALVLPRRDEPLVLNQAQQNALHRIQEAMHAGIYRTFLLLGVTGSGKTEIYLQAIQRCLEQGRQAICLVPEIALTPQTHERFQARFGPWVGMCHADVDRREKHRLARALRRGDVRIVLGARSAVFAPVPDLGLLVVDEEHESTYKQSSGSPRYHARDAGLMRARAAGAVAVLGSATPSLESHYNARQGKYELLALPDRIEGINLPRVEILDMAEELREHRNPSLFSHRLDAAIRDRLARREQVILFLNRRGFANYTFCAACGYVPRCTRDDMALTYHLSAAGQEETPTPEEMQGDLFDDLFEESQSDKEAGKSLGSLRKRKAISPKSARHITRPMLDVPDAQGRRRRLVCHFCGRTIPMPPRCPECAAPALQVIGQGTQRIEEELAGRYPSSKILRMDSDTMSRRAAYEEAWDRITRGEVDIILGTQMIAKGFHLERVTLVGVVLADVSLFVPDFRSAERTFALLTQVAGRAGRGERPGEVIIQTYVPRAEVIQCAIGHDVARFTESELRRRNWLRFPPIHRLAAVEVAAVQLESALDASSRLAGILRRMCHWDDYRECSILGPMAPPLGRLKNRWRRRILVRAPEPVVLHSLLRAALKEFATRPRSPGMHLLVDIDPLDLM